MSFGATSLVWHHSKAKGTDLLVLISIANFISDQGAWPKVETIAQGARTSVRQVHRSLLALKELGEITWERGQGTGAGIYKTSRYWITLTCPDECSGDWNHTMRQFVTSRPDNLSPLDLTHTADKPVIEPVIEPVNKTYVQAEPKQTVEYEKDFESFWSVYPRKSGKLKAQIAFKKALRLVSLDDLIAGAKRYANDPNRSPSFTAEASSWLNAGRWDDEPLAPRVQSWDERKEQQAIISRKQTEASRRAAQEALEASRKAAQEATAPKLCRHGKTIVRCLDCAKSLD